MAVKKFVDTNVFVYAADESPQERPKRAIAERVLGDDPESLVVSTQVLQEFYVTVTRKLRVPLARQRATDAVRGMAKLEVVPTDLPLVLSAIDTSRKADISLWDALIVEAAHRAACEQVLTEDLSHGQKIRDVTITNPFRENTQD